MFDFCGALVACDDKHRVARFSFLFLAQGDEFAEALFYALNFRVGGLVELSLPLGDKVEHVQQSRPQHGGADARLAGLERLGTEELGGVRLPVIGFTQVARAAKAGRKPCFGLLGFGLARLTYPMSIDVNSHDGGGLLLLKPFRLGGFRLIIVWQEHGRHAAVGLGDNPEFNVLAVAIH